jgi:hypothetical protein
MMPDSFTLAFSKVHPIWLKLRKEDDIPKGSATYASIGIAHVWTSEECYTNLSDFFSSPERLVKSPSSPPPPFLSDHTDLRLP